MTRIPVWSGYIEKPSIDYLVSMGIYVFEPKVLTYISNNQYLDLPDLIRKMLAAGEKVAGFPYAGYWQDLGRPDDYERATHDFEVNANRFSKRGIRMDWKIPLADIDFDSREEDAVLEVIRSRWLTMGWVTQAFEDEFSAYVGARHAIAVANGTAALHLACLGIGLEPGDEVILPS